MDNVTGASDSVLEALTGALQLDEAERAHLFDLARAANAGASAANARRRSAPQRVRPSVQRVLDAITGAPAWVRNGRMDFLAANRLGAALYAPLLTSPARPTNNARFMFLDSGSKGFYLDLTYEAMEIPADPGLTLLVYTAKPDTATQEALNFLASWATTHEQVDQPQTTQPSDHA